MPEPIAPAAPPEPCHVVPSFGCDGCIRRDREAFARQMYNDWKASYKLPRCKGCMKPMLHGDWGFDSKTVWAEVVCSGFDGEGVPTCEDQDVTVTIA